MRRSTPNPSPFSLFRAGAAGAIGLIALLACGEYGTSIATTPNDVVRVSVASVNYTMPDSVKLGLLASGSATMMVPFGMSADVRSAPVSAASTVLQACGGSGVSGYTSSRVPFIPEPSPKFAVASSSLSDDGYVMDSSMPIGFDFSFYGNTYNKVNIFMNGFLMFGQAPPVKQSGSAVGGFLPANINPMNIVALAWTDWDPRKSADPIRFETQGTAPNRKFVVQFNNVLEVSGAGLLMGQIVLSEGSNDITLYTNSMSAKNAMHFVTQGMQNLPGTEAVWDSVQNPNNGVWSRRVHNSFSLSNDAIRFSLAQTKDDIAPAFTVAPVNLTANNDPGLASAVVAVVPPAATDNCTSATVNGVRSDGKGLADPYPVGVTTITWTAKDDAQNSATAPQTVTVFDVEAPVFLPTTLAIVRVNATSPNGAVVTFDPRATDNVAVTSIVCEPPSGSVFPVGINPPVHCTAFDAAGNNSSHSFTVEVIDAHTQVFNLLQYVIDLNLPNGTAQPVINQLSAAYDGEGAQACKKMGDFMSMVQKKDANIPADQVRYVLAEASRIVGAMSCPAPKRAIISVTPAFQRIP